MPLNSSPPEEPVTETSGTLFVVATPIGNRDDITIRALKTLASVDMVAAEDTRHTSKLLAMHNIAARLISFQEHNETQRTPELLAKLTAGSRIALVSDAGTPSVSDPGFRLVTAAVAAGIRVVPIPGVSAAVTAISVSGLPTDSFVFVGFAPKKPGARRRQLEDLAREPRTLVFYESPRRILSFVQEIRDVLGDRQAVLGREMTKSHEEFIRGLLSDIRSALQEKESIRGECTLLVAGAEKKALYPPPENLADEVRRALTEARVRPSDLARTLSARFGLPRKTVYDQILEVQKEATK